MRLTVTWAKIKIQIQIQIHKNTDLSKCDATIKLYLGHKCASMPLPINPLLPQLQISGSPNSTSHSCSSRFLVFPTDGWFYLPSRINNRQQSCIFFPWPKLLLCLPTSSQISGIFVKYLSKAIMVFGLLLE